jgi:hypothetical protein
MGAAIEWTVEYIDSNTDTVVYTDPTTYNYNGWSDPAPLAVGSYEARITDDLGCVVGTLFPVECATIACPPNPHVINPTIKNPTYFADSASCLPDGGIELQVISLGNGAGYIDQVELFNVSGGTSTSIQVDPGDYFVGDIIAFDHLAEGDYEYTITDDIGCSYTELFTIACLIPVPGCTDPAASNYDPLATVDDGSCVYPCTPGNFVWDPNRGAWFTDPGYSSINDILLIPSHVVSDDCNANPVVVNTNASLNLEVNSISSGASNYSYEFVPGNNVDAFYSTIYSASSFSAPTGIPNYHAHNFNVSDPSAVGDWQVIISDDQGNEECYSFTIDCEAIPDSWDCDAVWGNCYDPGTGLGQYSSLLDCQNNCSGLQYPSGRYNIFRFCRTHNPLSYSQYENVSLEVHKVPNPSTPWNTWDQIQSITDLTPGYAAAYGGPVAGYSFGGTKMWRRYNPAFWPNGLAEITFKVTWQSGHTKTFIMKASVKSSLTHNTLTRMSGGMSQNPPEMYPCTGNGYLGAPLKYEHGNQSGNMQATYDPSSVNPIGTISKAEVISDPAGLLVNHREAYHHMCLCNGNIGNNKVSASVWDLESRWGDGFKPNGNNNQEQVIKIHTAVVEANSNLKYLANNGTYYENVLDIVADFTPQQVNSYAGIGEVWKSNGGQNIFGSISDFFQTHSALGQESFFFETIVYADELNC